MGYDSTEIASIDFHVADDVLGNKLVLKKKSGGLLDVPLAQAGAGGSSGNKELGYSDRVSNFAFTVSTGATAVEIPELAVTFDADGVTPIFVEGHLWAFATTSVPRTGIFEVHEGLQSDPLIMSAFASTATAGAFTVPVLLKSRRFIPAAGSHTYRVWCYLLNTGGTATIYANDNDRATLRVVEAAAA